MVAGDGKIPFLQPIKRDYKWFKRGDLDALPALFFDNLSSILGIIFAMASARPRRACRAARAPGAQARSHARPALHPPLAPHSHLSRRPS